MINENILKSCHAKGYFEEDVYGAYKIFFGTLFSEPRLKILNLLRKGEKNVTEIIKELGEDQTATSHNLSRLRKCGFVEVKTKGKYRYYSLNQETVKPLMDLIDAHMNKYCIHILNEVK